MNNDPYARFHAHGFPHANKGARVSCQYGRDTMIGTITGTKGDYLIITFDGQGNIPEAMPWMLNPGSLKFLTRNKASA